MRAHPLPAACLLFATVATAPAAALAHGGGGAMPAEVPAAPPGDGAGAQALLRDIEARAAADEETARATAEPIKNARRALERAHGARASGDDLHARMLWGLALTWAETARDVARAAAAERAAHAAGKKAYEIQTRAERARALLEETQARRGRTGAELVRVESESKEAARGAADTEAQRLEAAKRRGGPAAAAPTGGGSARPRAEGSGAPAPRPKEKSTAAPKKGAK